MLDAPDMLLTAEEGWENELVDTNAPRKPNQAQEEHQKRGPNGDLQAFAPAAAN